MIQNLQRRIYTLLYLFQIQSETYVYMKHIIRKMKNEFKTSLFFHLFGFLVSGNSFLPERRVFNCMKTIVHMNGVDLKKKHGKVSILTKKVEQCHPLERMTILQHFS